MKKIFLFVFFLSGFLSDIYSQDTLESNKKIEIGLDFMKFNEDWFYNNGYLFNVEGEKYIFDFTPSVFIRFINNRNALRLKFEFFQNDYSYDSDSYDFTWWEDGNYKNARLLCGYQRFLIDKTIVKFFAFSDLGLSYYNYKGFEGTYNGWTMEGIRKPFDINGIGISIQSGLGFKFKLIRGISIDLESSILLERNIDTSDEKLLLQDIKFIPRPLCLLGVSYTF
ncbi:MAG: hypothetical protein RBU28_05340 [Bacteroidales bacterium]|jgi:hypothetical protein|nr:hypothetical protein [Bacteroidales bacterium]